MNRISWRSLIMLWAMGAALLALASCAGAMPKPASRAAPVADATLPTLAPITLAAGEKLRVVATTNIIGDVVRQIGGDAIDLAQLLPAGTDPHSYQARPDDLRQLNRANVIFINGLHLEEAMQPVLANLDGNAPVIAVNIGVPIRELGDAATGHAGVDPHTWMDARNVKRWVENIAAVLSALDPAHAELFVANAAAYQTQLDELHQELVAAAAAIPVQQRNLVTDHDNLGYLADAYGFTVTGAVIPSLSTLAAPSAQELAALQQQVEQEDVKAIFVGTTVNPNVANQIASDTGAVVAPIYTGSLSDASGPAATYIDMMRYDMTQIVAALQQ